MIGLRIRNGLIAAAGLALPLALGWGILLAGIAAKRSESRPADSPNPQPTPLYFLGPIEVLVRRDPYYAGIAAVLLIPIGVVYTGLVVAASQWWPRPVGNDGENHSWRLAGIAIGLGLLPAAPWWIAIMTRG